MKRVGLISMVAATALVAAGCEQSDDRMYYDGQYFKTKTQAVDKKVTRALFITTVSGVSASLDGARQAAQHEGTRYCIENYGTSNIQWALDPAAEDQTLTVVDDKLSFQGTCRP